MVSFKLSKSLLGANKDILCTFAYIPPYQSPYYGGKDITCAISNLEDFLMDIAQNGEDMHQMVIGDLNARIADWSLELDDDGEDFQPGTDSCAFIRCSEDKTVNQFGKHLKDLCNTFQLTPLNGLLEGDKKGKFTFVAEQGNSVIDFVLLSAEAVSIHKLCFHVEDRVESSHSPIHVSLLIKDKEEPHTLNQKSKNANWNNIWKWDSSKSEEFKEAIKSADFTEKLNTAFDKIDTCADSAINLFTENILGAADCMRRRVRINTDTAPTNKWYDRECIVKKRAARKALDKYSKTRNEFDKTAYRQLRSEYKQIIQEKKKKHRQLMQESLLADMKNSCKFWNTVKKARCKKTSQPNIDLESWHDHFQQVFSGIGLEKKELVNETNADNLFVPHLDNPIREDEVQEAIRNLKLGKAAGLDNVCTEFLKYAGDVVTPFLTKLYNRLYNAGYFPVSWCTSIVIPLFKKGDADLLDNYRGISLLSVVGKVFTAVLHKRFYEWAEEENKLSFEQAGFRKGYSTVDHIFTLVAVIRNRLNSTRGCKVYAAFIDYRKAFDMVDRDKLWHTLDKMQTSPKLINLLKSMYSSVQSCVRWNGELSECFDCPVGVRQGCLLSPILFSLLISEVADYVRSFGKHGLQLIPGGMELFLLLFADDIVLLSSTPTGLQNQIKNLEKVSKLLGLQVNIEKTKVMVFRKGGPLSNREHWFYDGKQIEVVNKYKYLGFLLTTKLSDISACEEYASKAKGKVVDILKTMWALGNLNSKLFFQLFDAQVKPMLLYASEVWGLLKPNIIEKVHMFACKRLLSVSDKTSNNMVYGETGRYPLFIDASVATIRYWLRLISMPDNRIPKQTMQMLLNKLNANDFRRGNNWVENVKDCLESHGFGNVWANRGIENEAAFLRNLKQKMIDKFKADWFATLCGSDRFSIYRLFKFDFGLEPYLNNVTVKRFRDALIRFRLGINDLGINKRFQGANVCRDCPFCPKVLEDECHFLFECVMYTDLRQKFLADFDDCDLEHTLLNQDYELQRRVAMYIYSSLKKREDTLS